MNYPLSTHVAWGPPPTVAPELEKSSTRAPPLLLIARTPRSSSADEVGESGWPPTLEPGVDDEDGATRDARTSSSPPPGPLYSILGRREQPTSSERRDRVLEDEEPDEEAEHVGGRSISGGGRSAARRPCSSMPRAFLGHRSPRPRQRRRGSVAESSRPAAPPCRVGPRSGVRAICRRDSRRRAGELEGMACVEHVVMRGRGGMGPCSSTRTKPDGGAELDGRVALRSAGRPPCSSSVATCRGEERAVGGKGRPQASLAPLRLSPRSPPSQALPRR
ncbi:unnamed protein product [Urochloa humidicola]